MTPTATVPSVTETLTDDEFVNRRGYVWLDAEVAARDPRTPESYLVYELGLRNAAQLTAMLERRPVSPQFVTQLVRWVSDTRTLAGRGFQFGNEAVVKAAELPHLTTAHLRRLVEGVYSFSGGHHDACVAIVNHPVADEEVAASVLCFGDGAFGTGTALERRVGSAGFIAAAALRLVRIEAGWRRATQREAYTSTLAVMSELERDLTDAPDARRVLAALGPTWTGDRASLLTACTGVATPVPA